MAFQESATGATFPIGGALAANLFVVINASGQVAAATDGAQAIGVTLEGVTAGEYDSGDGQTTISVALLHAGGKVPVEAAATTAISIGDAIASDANGNAIPAATGDAVLGYALQAAGVDADQEVITVLLAPEAKLQL